MSESNEQKNNSTGTVEQISSTANDNPAVTALVIAGLVAGGLGGYFTIPAWAVDVLLGGGFAGIIGYIAGGKIAEWYSSPPDFELVSEIDSEREICRGWFVPPDWWDDRINESKAHQGAHLLNGSGNYIVRELDFDDENEQVVISQAPARRKIAERPDIDIETWVDAIYRQRADYRDTVLEAAEIKKHLPEIRDEIAAQYYENETRSLEEAGEHDEDVLFDPVDKRVQEIREEARSDLTDKEKAVREILRDHPLATEDDFERVNGSDFERFNLEFSSEGDQE